MYVGNLTDSPMIVLENSASFKIKILYYRRKYTALNCFIHVYIILIDKKKVKTLIFQCLSGL